MKEPEKTCQWKNQLLFTFLERLWLVAPVGCLFRSGRVEARSIHKIALQWHYAMPEAMDCGLLLLPTHAATGTKYGCSRETTKVAARQQGYIFLLNLNFKAKFTNTKCGCGGCTRSDDNTTARERITLSMASIVR